MTKKERIIIFLLATLNFTHILDFMIMMPLGNYLMPFFKINPQQFSMLVAAYTIAASISGFLAAFFIDSLDRKKSLLFAFTGFLLATLACGFAPTYEVLLVSRLIAGVFGGLIGAQVIAIISDLFTYERRGRAMGAAMSAFAIASVLGIPLALYLSNLFSWHAPFIFIAALGFFLIPFLIKYLPEINSHLEPGQKIALKLDGLKRVLSERKQVLALLFTGFVMFGHFLVVPFINPFLEFNLGYSKSITPLIYLVGGTAAFFSANILGRVSDRVGKLKVFRICVFISLPLVIVLTHLVTIPYWIVLLLFACWFTVSTGRGVTSQAMVSHVADPKYRGSFQNFNSSLQQAGTGLASLVAGFVVVEKAGGRIGHYSRLGYLSVGVLVVALLLAQFLFSPRQQSVVK
ncbi:MAG TPA: MFS transporter [Ferruginibacter sp.]|nr:MFS transporter [Ferruginibacter sp.]HRO17900.1 MFS transporter [Ferruginibacter sp.]HRQ21361.1 MFS transporter [Ferruginibacter sp.]